MLSRSATIALAAAAIALAAPAAAPAAEIAPLAPCYRSVDAEERETVPVAASGFTPGEPVAVLIDGIEQWRGHALENGEVIGSVEAPYQRRGEREFTLTVTEPETAANTVSATSRVAALSLRLKPRTTRPTKRVRFLGRGFIDGPEVFAHYVRGDRLRKTVSLGTPQGPCGRVSARRRQLPFKRPRVGRWTLQVDNQATYSEQPAGVAVRVPITVRRTPRQP